MNDTMDAKDFILKCKNDIIYFAEHMLRTEEGDFYKLEEHQKEMITCTDSQVLYFLGRRMGKSFTLAIQSLHQALFFKYQTIFVLSPTNDQASELADTINGLIERSVLLEQEVIVDNKLEKKFKNGSRIKIRTAGGKGNVSSVIGSGVNILILDEIQDLSEDLIYKILPTVRGQSGKSRLITAGTPRNKSGFLYENYISACKLWNNGDWIYDKNKKGKFTVFMKQTAFLDENDEIIASGTPRITIDELYEDLNTMPLIEFKQEYCLDFMSSISDVYPDSLQAEVFYKDKENTSFRSKKPVVYGLDVGKMRNESVLTIGEVIPAPTEDNKSYKKIDVKYYKEFPLGTDYDEIEDYCAYELPRFFPNIIRGVIDATGVGVPVFEAIEKKVKKGLKPYLVEPYKFSKEKKKDLVEGGVAALERGQVRIAYHPRLKKEMTGYKRELTDSNNIVYAKQAGSDDYVDSLNLCLYNIALGLLVKPPIAVSKVPKTIQKTYRDEIIWHKEKIRKPMRQKPLNKIRRRL